VVRDPGHRHPLTLAQFPRGERYAEDRGGALGILAEGLVEITQAKEEDGISVVLFYPLVLLEYRDRFQSSGQDTTRPSSCQAVASSISTWRTVPTSPPKGALPITTLF
jgi:hypothetical protein